MNAAAAIGNIQDDGGTALWALIVRAAAVHIPLTMLSVIFLASPSSIMVLSR